MDYSESLEYQVDFLTRHLVEINLSTELLFILYLSVSISQEINNSKKNAMLPIVICHISNLYTYLTRFSLIAIVLFAHAQLT